MFGVVLGNSRLPASMCLHVYKMNKDQLWQRTETFIAEDGWLKRIRTRKKFS
jgi:hypothetical protein